MSAEIDNRIVQMSFENKEFEKGVQKTLATLKDLEDGLKLEGAEEGFEKVSEAAKGVDFSAIEKGLAAITDKFTLWGMTGLKMLENVSNKIVNVTEKFVKSLTVDPIKDGWGEYELKLNSVQTILAGVKKQFGSEEEALDAIGESLSNLNEYADKTIYSFSQMTANIGKFTNAGVGLKEATASIRGISNLAALAGASSADNNRAMYNIAQSLSTGSVKLIDWKSIENANMATKEFKSALISVANTMGTLKSGKTKKGLDVITNFNDSLQQGWLTSDVLIETLQILSKDYTLDELRAKYGDVADEFWELGSMAEEAATSVRTLTQLIDTLKEAAGSGWAESWEILVGGYAEAKRIFTSINNYISPILEAMANRRNSILKVFASNGGRDKMWNTVLNFFNLLQRLYWVIDRVINNALSPFGDVWNVVGDAMTSVMTEIDDGFEKIHSWARGLGLDAIVKEVGELKDAAFGWKKDSPLGYLESTLSGLAGVVSMVAEVIGNAVRFAGRLVIDILPLVEAVLGVLGALGDALFGVYKEERRGNVIFDFFQRLYDVLQPIIRFLVGTFVGVLNDVALYIKAFFALFSTKAAYRHMGEYPEHIQDFMRKLNKVVLPVKNFFARIGDWWNKTAYPVIKLLSDFLAGHGKNSDFAKNLRKAPKSVQRAWMRFAKVMRPIYKGITAVIDFFKGLWKAVTDAFGAFASVKYDDSLSPLENFDRRLKAFADSFANSDWWKGITETWDKVKGFFTERFGPAIAKFFTVDTSDGKTLGEKLQIRIDAFLNTLDPDGSIQEWVKKAREAISGGWEKIRAYLFGGDVLEKANPNAKAELKHYDGILTPIVEDITSSLQYAEEQITSHLFGEQVETKDAEGNLIKRWQGGPLSFLANFYDDWIAPIVKDFEDMAGSIPRAISMLFDENMTDENGQKLTFGQRLDAAIAEIKNTFSEAAAQLGRDIANIVDGIFGEGTAEAISKAWDDFTRFLFGGWVEDHDDGDEMGQSFLRYQEGIFSQISKWKTPSGRSIWDELKYFFFGGDEKKDDGTVEHHQNLFERISALWTTIKEWYDKDVGPWLNPILADIKEFITLLSGGIIGFLTADIPETDAEGNPLDWKQRLEIRFQSFGELIEWIKNKINTLTKQLLGVELFPDKPETAESSSEGGSLLNTLLPGFDNLLGNADKAKNEQLAELEKRLAEASDSEEVADIERQIEELQNSGVEQEGGVFGLLGSFGETMASFLGMGGGEGGGFDFSFLGGIGETLTGSIPQIAALGGAAILGGKLFGKGKDGENGFFATIINFFSTLGSFALKLALSVAILSSLKSMGVDVKGTLNDLIVFILEVLGAFLGVGMGSTGIIGIINTIREKIYAHNNDGSVEGFKKTEAPNLVEMIESLGTGLNALADAIWKFLGLAVTMNALGAIGLTGNFWGNFGHFMELLAPMFVIMLFAGIFVSRLIGSLAKIADDPAVNNPKEVKMKMWESFPDIIDSLANLIDKIAGALWTLLGVTVVSNIAGGIEGLWRGFLFVALTMALMAGMMYSLSQVVKEMTAAMEKNKNTKWDDIFKSYFFPIISVVLGLGILAIMLATAFSILPENMDTTRMGIFMGFFAVIGTIVGVLSYEITKLISDDSFKPDWEKLGQICVVILVGVMAVFLSLALLLGSLAIFDTIEIESSRAWTFLEMAGAVTGVISGISAAITKMITGLNGSGETIEWGQIGKAVVIILAGVMAVALSVAVLLAGLAFFNGIEIDTPEMWSFLAVAGVVSGIVAALAEVAANIAQKAQGISLGAIGKAFVIILAVAAVVALIIWALSEILKNNLASISELMAGVGTGLKSFHESMSGVTDQQSKDADTIVRRIVGLMAYISTELIDVGKIDAVAMAIWRIGLRVRQTYDRLKDVDKETMESVAGFPKIFADKLSEVKDTEGLDAALANANKTNDIAVAFQGAMTAIEGTSTKKDELIQDATAVNEIAGKIVEISTTLTGLGDTSSIQSSLTSLSGSIGLFIGALNQMSEDGGWTIDNNGLIKEIDPLLMKAFFLTLAESIPDDGETSQIFQRTAQWAQVGGSQISDFAIGMENLKTAVKDYATTISDKSIDWDAMSNSERFLSVVSDISTKLPADYSFADELHSHQTVLGQFSTDIIKLGNAVKSYGKAISGFNPIDFLFSTAFLTALADMQQRLTQDLIATNGDHVTWDDALNSFGSIQIEEGTASSLTQFAKDIGEIAGAVEDFSNAITSETFSQEQFDAAIVSLGLLADLGVKLSTTSRDANGDIVVLKSELGGLWSNQQIAGDNLKTFGDALKNVGTGVSSMVTSLKDSDGKFKDTSILSTVATHLQGFVDIAKQLAFTYDEWSEFGSTKKYTIGLLGNDLLSFSTQIGTIAGNIDRFLTDENLASWDRLRTLLFEPFTSIAERLYNIGFAPGVKTPFDLLGESVKSFNASLTGGDELTLLTSYVTQYSLFADALERIATSASTLNENGFTGLSIVVDDSGIPKGVDALNDFSGGNVNRTITYSAYATGMLEQLQNGNITLKMDQADYDGLKNEISNVKDAVGSLSLSIRQMKVLLYPNKETIADELTPFIDTNLGNRS